MKPIYAILLALVVLVGAGGAVLFSTPTPKENSTDEQTAMNEDATTSPQKNGNGITLPNMGSLKPKIGTKPYKEIVKPSGFVNTGIDASGNPKPITIAELVGKKVILVDFLTYSCINCQRTFPYINAWYEKYKDQGLEVIGIHTPEFAFEKDINNVREAMKKFGITHPVVLDNDYATWGAYGNQYWPRKYLIDIYGNIVYDHIGEGAYEETEQKIQELLAERAKVLGETAMKSDTLVASGIPEAQIVAASPETYFGSARNQNLGSGTPGVSGEQNFSEPQTVASNKLYLIGKWKISPEYAETSASVGSSATGSDRINFLYTAKGVYFVAGASTTVEAEVTLDSAPVPQSIKGADIYYKNGRSYVKIEKNQLYKLVDASSAEKHLLEIIISSPGLQAFTFTFG